MSLADAFAPAEAHYRSQVMADTWGHLAPRRNVIYRGHVIWALGCFGSDNLNPTVLDFEMESRTGLELNSSPWFYDCVIDFLQKHSKEEGAVFRFDGSFRNYVFTGKITRLKLVAETPT